MSEHPISSQPFEQLEDHRLQVFEELCLKQGERGTSLISELTSSCAYEVSNSPYGGQSSQWPFEISERCLEHKPEIRELIANVYDSQHPKELTNLFATDLAAWSSLHKAFIQLSPYSPGHVSEHYQHEIEIALTMIEQQGGIFSDRSDKYPFPSAYHHLGLYYPEEMPQLDKRVEAGMPREMQLLGAVMMVPGQFGITEEGMFYGSFRFRALCWELNLSGEEIRTVYRMAAKAKPEKASDLLTVVLDDPDMLNYFTDQSGRLDQELFGESANLGNALKDTFLSLVKENGGKALQRWERIGQVLEGGFIESVAPVEQRQAIVRKMVVERIANFKLVPIVLNEYLETYVDDNILAQDCFIKLEQLLASPNIIRRNHGDRQPSFHAESLGKELGVDLRPEALRISEQPYRELIAAIVRLSDSPELQQQTALMMQKAEVYNPQIRDLLKEFSKIANDECFESLGQGYSYDDEPEWYDAREARQIELTPQLDSLRDAIRLLATTLN